MLEGRTRAQLGVVVEPTLKDVVHPPVAPRVRAREAPKLLAVEAQREGGERRLERGLTRAAQRVVPCARNGLGQRRAILDGL